MLYACMCVVVCVCWYLCIFLCLLVFVCGQFPCTFVCTFCIEQCVHVHFKNICVGSDACLEAAPVVPPTLPENSTSSPTPPMPRLLGACAGEEVNPDLVTVYADRLCAVMHAFATVCTTLQRASGR